MLKSFKLVALVVSVLTLYIVFIFPYIPLTSFYYLSKDATVNFEDAPLPVLSDGVIYETGLFPTSISVLDIDGNGYDDLLVTGMEDDSISTFINDEHGGFDKVQYLLGFVDKPRLPGMGDLDTDGWPDLVVPNWAEDSSTVSLFANNKGIFDFKQKINVGYRPRKVTTGDLNNDGFVDLIVADNFSNTITIIQNSKGIFDPKNISTIQSDIEPGSVTLGDIDNDGTLEIISTMRKSNTVNVYKSTNGLLFSLKQKVKVGAGPKEELLLDYDSDSDLDIIVVSGDGRLIQVLENNGSGSFNVKNRISSTGFPHSIKLLSKNGNNYSLVTAEYPNWVIIYNLSSTGELYTKKRIWVGGVAVTGSLYVNVIDSNNDGQKEIVVTRSKDNSIELLSINF
jgi:hypothetical protein